MAHCRRLAGRGEAVTYRAKLLALFTATVVLVTAVVAGLASTSMRRSFERLEEQRTNQLLSQFRHEFARRGEEVSRRVEVIAVRDSTLRMAADLGRSSPDYAPYVNEAGSLAAAHQLDFLELIARDGAIVSSAQWPARFGYKEEWITAPVDWNTQSAFLKREDVPDGTALALLAVREVRGGDSVLYIAGGERLDRSFLSTLSLPPGLRAMLYLSTEPAFSPQALTDASGPVAHAEKLAPVVQQIQQQGEQSSQVVWWSADPASAEAIYGIPLKGRHSELLGMLLVGSSRRDVVQMEKHIRLVAMLVGAAGVLLGLVLSGWAATQATRPVEQLADVAREVAAGNWWARVPITSNDEFGELASAFNLMTHELTDQRERLVQAERVAAWRELARRLAHELKNPLFPLQITVENLLRAKEQNPAQFEEVFRESAGTLLAEIANLRAIVQRFSDFARMPAPELQPVRLNELAEHVLKLLEPQFTAADRAPVTAKVELDPKLPVIQADPELINRALQNLVLNAIDAMPSGGTLALRTGHGDGVVTLSVSDTGTGLTREECERLFTPYYTTKQHGTGLGLAIVQSVVSDHHGKITVESELGRGSTFRIELPLQMPETKTSRGANV
jgi:signal transduction histidine kinase